MAKGRMFYLWFADLDWTQPFSYLVGCRHHNEHHAILQDREIELRDGHRSSGCWGDDMRNYTPIKIIPSVPERIVLGEV